MATGTPGHAVKLLFICTHNRCRSILCEAIANHLSGDGLRAASAGSEPASAVHPLTLAHLAAHGISTRGLYSKSWDDVAGFDPDVVITVCDSAANETCPVWMGPVAKVHWGLADPSRTEGDEAAVAAAFRRTIALIERRIGRLLEMDTSTGDRNALVTQLNALADEDN